MINGDLNTDKIVQFYLHILFVSNYLTGCNIYYSILFIINCNT